jgi:hypothetical protein
MINLWSSVGACIATVISQLVVDIMQLYYVKDEINLKEMFKLSYKYFFAGIIMFACCMLVQIVLSGFACFVTQIIIGVCVYFGILILFKDEFIFLLINKVKEKIFNILSRG